MCLRGVGTDISQKATWTRSRWRLGWSKRDCTSISFMSISQSEYSSFSSLLFLHSHLLLPISPSFPSIPSPPLYQVRILIDIFRVLQGQKFELPAWTNINISPMPRPQTKEKYRGMRVRNTYLCMWRREDGLMSYYTHAPYVRIVWSWGMEE